MRTLKGRTLFVLTMALGLTGRAGAEDSETARSTLPAHTEHLGLDPAGPPCHLESLDCCRRWHFRFMPYGWVPAFNGDLTVRGNTTDVDAKIGQVFNVLTNEINWAALGQIEGSNGRFGFIFDGDYVDVQPGGRIRRLNFASDLRLAILDLTATYEAKCIPDALHLPCGSRFEFLAGVRYYSLSSNVTVAGPRGIGVGAEGTEDWLDPILGVRVRVPFRHCLTGQVRADVGGFGAGSQFAWNIVATLEYRFSSRFSLVGGWRWLDVDYRAGSGNQEFRFDMLLSGPMLGFAFDF